jgi:Ras-related C3 botulinum toxin substrate 1
MPERSPIKCVLVGDTGVGKTSLLVKFTTNIFPSEYVCPEVFDNYTQSITVDGHPTAINLVDLDCSEDGKGLRALSYPGTDVFIMCFSMASMASFLTIGTRWMLVSRLQVISQ